METPISTVSSSVEELIQPTPIWRVSALSQIGTSHEKKGLCCQDAHYLDQSIPGILIIAVADGAGSAKLSDVGAALAVKSSVERIRSILVDSLSSIESIDLNGLLSDAIAGVRAQLNDEATARQVEVESLATTLILVIATPTFVIAAQVGDGAVVFVDLDGAIRSLTVPKQGEYINEVTFITSDDALESLQIEIWPGEIANLAVFSDGIQLLCLSSPDWSPHPGFFRPLFSFISAVENNNRADEELGHFLGSDKIKSLTDDDLTLVLASRRR